MAKRVKIPTPADLKKRYATSGKADIILPEDNVIKLPSRVLPFNYQIGGGIPYGRMMELFGWESTGKSLLAGDFAYATQYLGGQVLWADLENSWTNHWAEKQGLDVSEIELLTETNSIETFSDWMADMIIYYRSKLTNNEPILLVCDSIAGGETLANIEGSQTDRRAEMGNRAKAWDMMYRMRMLSTIKKYGVCCIMINQLRSKVGASMFESSETTPGGKSTAFYASIRVGLHKGKQIKGYMNKNGWKDDTTPKGKKVGQNVSTRIIKNKTFPPRDSVKTEVYFQEDKEGYIGYNKYLGLSDIALEQELVKKEGNTYSFQGKKIAGSRGDLDLIIHDNGKLRKVLCKKLKVNTISQTQDKIENLDKNLFPVKGSSDE